MMAPRPIGLRDRCLRRATVAGEFGANQAALAHRQPPQQTPAVDVSRRRTSTRCARASRHSRRRALRDAIDPAVEDAVGRVTPRFVLTPVVVTTLSARSGWRRADQYGRVLVRNSLDALRGFAASRGLDLVSDHSTTTRPWYVPPPSERLPTCLMIPFRSPSTRLSPLKLPFASVIPKEMKVA
jgi:hypothetical protein